MTDAGSALGVTPSGAGKGGAEDHAWVTRVQGKGPDRSSQPRGGRWPGMSQARSPAVPRHADLSVRTSRQWTVDVSE